jgi:hypothetical protein
LLVGAPERDGGASVAVDGDEIHPVEWAGTLNQVSDPFGVLLWLICAAH